MKASDTGNTRTHTGPLIHTVVSADQLPRWADRPTLISFFHETMKPYEDTPEDVGRALDYAFHGPGGFLTLAEVDQQLVGAVLILKTGMGGYIPAHILLFISVDPRCRNQGIGAQLLEHVIGLCGQDLKLHVEYDNPARRLYERAGFTTKYAEMRYVPR